MPLAFTIPLGHRLVLPDVAGTRSIVFRAATGQREWEMIRRYGGLVQVWFSTSSPLFSRSWRAADFDMESGMVQIPYGNVEFTYRVLWDGGKHVEWLGNSGQNGSVVLVQSAGSEEEWWKVWSMDANGRIVEGEGAQVVTRVPTEVLCSFFDPSPVPFVGPDTKVISEDAILVPSSESADVLIIPAYGSSTSSEVTLAGSGLYYDAESRMVHKAGEKLEVDRLGKVLRRGRPVDGLNGVMAFEIFEEIEEAAPEEAAPASASTLSHSDQDDLAISLNAIQEHPDEPTPEADELLTPPLSSSPAQSAHLTLRKVISFDKLAIDRSTPRSFFRFIWTFSTLYVIAVIRLLFHIPPPPSPTSSPVHEEWEEDHEQDLRTYSRESESLTTKVMNDTLKVVREEHPSMDTATHKVHFNDTAQAVEPVHDDDSANDSESVASSTTIADHDDVHKHSKSLSSDSVPVETYPSSARIRLSKPHTSFLYAFFPALEASRLRVEVNGEDCAERATALSTAVFEVLSDEGVEEVLFTLY